MHHRTLEHLDLLCAPDPARKTFALQWSVPLGSARGGVERDGFSPLHVEMAQRGGGGRDAKEFAYALDNLGVRRSVRLGTHFLHVDVVGLPEALLPTITLCADAIREPNITSEHLKSAKLLVSQGRRSVEDDPGELARDHLRQLHAPAPFDRSDYGREEVVGAVNSTPNSVGGTTRQVRFSCRPVQVREFEVEGERPGDLTPTSRRRRV